tara:strand:- start:983 stop:1252 length:270 start_codon:yes stop_codon:yes gene_type:complete
MEQWTIINPLDEGIEHADGVTIEGPEGVVATNVLEQHAACIAAVPDLLAALESFVEAFNDGHFYEKDLRIAKMKACDAIALVYKAEGGE